MSNAIANASLILSANSAQMTQGLNKASGEINAFSTKINESLTFTGTGATGMLVSGFKSAYEWGEKLYDVCDKSAMRINDLSRNADGIGLNVNSFQAFTALSDVRPEELVKVMNKLNQAAGEAIIGNK